MKGTNFFERLKRFCSKNEVLVVTGFLVFLFGVFVTCFAFYRFYTISNIIEDYSSLEQTAKPIYSFANDYCSVVWLCAIVGICVSIGTFYDFLKILLKMLKERNKRNERI